MFVRDRLRVTVRVMSKYLPLITHTVKLKDRKITKNDLFSLKNPVLNTKIFNYCGFKMVPDCKTKQLITVVLK